MKSPALLLLLLGLVAQTSAVDIIGHRGASHDAPENTLAAFKLGWEQGADAVELDIWLTKDGKIVCLHDADTKRTTGVLKKVAESTLDELRTLDAGTWKDAKWRGEKLPTLTEALAAIPAGKRLVIEIKAGVEILPELARDLKAPASPTGSWSSSASSTTCVPGRSGSSRRFPCFISPASSRTKRPGRGRRPPKN